MEINCPGCAKRFDKNKDQYCKNCYENQLFKGQCLNIAAMLTTRKPEESPDEMIKRVYALAKKMFNEGTEQNFLHWKHDKQAN